MKIIRMVNSKVLRLLVTGLSGALLSIAPSAGFGQGVAWPQFRGPDSNPVGTHARLADRWSKTENVEWSQTIPGRGWSSPIVTDGKVYLTTVTTEGKSKPPQTGTEYSNEYVAELQKQGLPMSEIIKRVTERDKQRMAEEFKSELAALSEDDRAQVGRLLRDHYVAPEAAQEIALRLEVVDAKPGSAG